MVKNRYGEDNKTIEYMWDIETGTYTLVGFKEEGEDETESKSNSPLRAKASRSARRTQSQVSREGVEAF